MSPIRVLIADDHPLLLEGLHLLLRRQQRIRIIGEAADGETLVRLAALYRPEVIITDIQMPKIDGVTATRQVRALGLGIEVIAFTMFHEEYLIRDMLQAGAKGYLLKNTSKEEMLQAIITVYGGGSYFCVKTMEKIKRNLFLKSFVPPTPRTATLFTVEELKIIRLICREFSVGDIAELLRLSFGTIEGHRERIFEKMGVHNDTGITVYVVKNRLFDLY